MQTSQTGRDAELLAQEFLKKKNYTILHANWRFSHSEIDIIAQQDNIIVFVEVKSRGSDAFGMPEEFVDDDKINKMEEAADAYIETFEWEGELRFDIIAVEKDGTITHFEDAFY